MAVTKTHPIKSTLKAAIDYILNPEKTDGKLLASSFGCGLETADIEFAWTREAAGDRGTHLGRHLIQSFAVGETTPEEARQNFASAELNTLPLMLRQSGFFQRYTAGCNQMKRR